MRTVPSMSKGRRLRNVLAHAKQTDYSRIESGHRVMKTLVNIGRSAGALAARKGREVGAPAVYTSNDKVYKVYPDGREEVVATAKESNLNSYFVKLKEGESKIRYASHK